MNLSNQNKTLEDFELLKKLVLDKKPVLAEILQKHGHKSLCDYAYDYLDVNLNSVVLSRQNEFLKVFGKEVEEVLGESIADSAVKQLQKYYFLSTADHHGPICHPFFLNSNLVTAATFAEHPDPILKNVVVLSCSNVSMANSSFPRGLIFTGANQGKTKSWQFGFFSNSSEVRGSRVYNFSAYTIEAINKIKQKVAELVRSNETSQNVADRIFGLLENIYAKPEILACQNYSDQITKTNFSLWKKMFHLPEEETSNLLYIELERVVNSLVSTNHLYQNTVINRIMFDPKWRNEFVKNFNGIFGGFDIDKKIGSMFFWALPQKSKYCQQLWVKGNFLETEDGSYKIALKPEEIEAAIKRKELIPTSQMSLLILSLYYGIKCLGGFSQVNYLTDNKLAYIKMMNDLGESVEADACLDRQTKELGEDLTIAFLTDKENKLLLASGLDLAVYGDKHVWPLLVSLTKKINLAEALDMMMPDFYFISYTEAERSPDLQSISPTDIINLTGIRSKIDSCISLF